MASGYDIGFGLPAPDTFDDSLSLSTRYLADLRRRVAEKLSGTTASAVALRDSLHEQLQAQAAQPTAKAQRVVDRLRGKASQALDQHIADTAVRLSPMGIEVPHASQLLPPSEQRWIGDPNTRGPSQPGSGKIVRGKLPPGGDLSVWRVAWIGDPPHWISIQPGVEVPAGYSVAGWFRDEHTAVQAQVLGNEFAGMHEPLAEVVDYVYGISAGYVPPTQDPLGSGAQTAELSSAVETPGVQADHAPDPGAYYTLWHTGPDGPGESYVVLADGALPTVEPYYPILSHVSYQRAMEEKYSRLGVFTSAQVSSSHGPAGQTYTPLAGVGPALIQSAIQPAQGTPSAETAFKWGTFINRAGYTINPARRRAMFPDQPGLDLLGTDPFAGDIVIFRNNLTPCGFADQADPGTWEDTGREDPSMHFLGYLPNRAAADAWRQQYCGVAPVDHPPTITPPPDPCAHPTYVYICNWPTGVTQTPPSNGTGIGPHPPLPPVVPIDQAPTVNALWQPCDENWCSNLESQLSQFAEFGDWWRHLCEQMDENLPHYFEETGSGFSGLIGDLVKSVLSAVVLGAAQIVKLLALPVFDAARVIVQQIGTGNPDAVLGLAVARLLLHAFAGRAGWDLGLKVEVHISLELSPALEQIDQLMRFASPTRVPAWPEVLELYRRDLVTETHALCLARFHGLDAGCAKKILRAVQERLTVDELIEFQRRKDYDISFVDDGMRALGWTDTDTRDARKYLFDELPPITDLLHFAATNATNEEIIARFGLGDEFERFWKDPLKPALSGQGVSEEWAKVHWQSHWVRPGVETAQAALRRLRPDQVDESIAFTEGDFDNVMRENDILPFWRERLKALAYNPPGIRFIKQLYELDVWDKEKVVNALQNINYSSEDALSLASMYEVVKLRDQVKAAHGWDIGTILKEYRDGLATEDQVRSVLHVLKYTDDQIDQSVAVAKTSIATEDRKHLLDALKHQYLTGLIDDGDLHDAITSTGVPIDRVQYLMTIWKAERQSKLHRGTISELRKYAIEGTISASELAQRLHVLGVSDDDIDRIYASISHEIESIEAKKEEATRHREQAAQEKRVRQEQAAAKRAAARLARRLKAQAKIEAAQEKGDLGVTLAETPDKVEKARLRAEAGVEEAQDAAELDAELPE